MPSLPAMELYWSSSFLAANAFIGLNLLGALLLGMLVGYERSYNGRAAGMRTYGLVCMASTALTIFVGFAPYWYGGAASQVPPDATRVVQGVVTGVGFLCAGVIVKDGLNVSGLTTAASIWAASAIGVLLGVGFYAAALMLSGLCMLSMSVVQRIEGRLPGRSIFDVSLSFLPDAAPEMEELAQVAHRLTATAWCAAASASAIATTPRYGGSALFRSTAPAPLPRPAGARPGALGRCGAVQHRSLEELTAGALAGRTALANTF